ncbi:MAG: ArsR family transcriptional regulator [Candidatus Wallbacteria bacterium]|nr:ArsR family transcriptional regulator [Candidatus Wallbacteria bacterium]
MRFLEELFLSKTRAEVFRLLFALRQKELHVRAIERESGMTVGAVREELRKLLAMDLVVSRRDGNRLYYAANTDHPLYGDLRSLVLKTDGLAGLLREALGSAQIDLAFVFGSMAAGAERGRSDVDLMIVGSIGLRETSRLLAGLSERIGRDINPIVMDAEEFHARRNTQDAFIENVLSKPKLFVVGGPRELDALA